MTVGRLSAAAVLLLSGVLFAQDDRKAAGAESAPTFFFDAITFASDQPNKSHIDVYVQVPYEELHFVHEGDDYVGRYNVTIGIYTPENKLVQERTWEVEIRTKDFAKTSSNRQFSLTQPPKGIEVDPGNYDLYVQVEDLDSRKSAKMRRALLVTNYEKDSLSLSDIMLVNRVTTEGDRRKIVPNISGNVEHLSEGFFLFFEVYNSTPSDSVALICKMFNSKKEQAYQKELVQALAGAKTQVFFKIDSLNLSVGTYLVTVEASPRSGKPAFAAATRASTARTFSVHWSDIPPSIVDLDKAIEQLKYIAKESELEYIKGAPDPEEKRRRFLEFWAKRDPDPLTPRNELMEEFYHRVDYANKNFSHYLEGWRTDRGMVYIRFGPPEHIERHPFDMNSKPYEIWYYYQLNREFVFVDESGFGDYRLRYPTTDLWGRIR